MNLGTMRRSRTAPNRETLLEIRDIVAVRTSGYRPGGLRCDFDRLPEDEQRRAIELVREADQGTWAWERLGDRKRKELEKLIERAADTPGIFQDTRSMEEIVALAGEANRQAVRRPFRRSEEKGLLHELGEQLAGGFASVNTVSAIVMTLIAMERGQAFGPQGRVERDADGEPVLVIDGRFGLSTERQDWRGTLAAWQQGLTQASRNGWVEIDRSGGGNEWRVKLGSRARRAMRGAPKERKAA
jgi:hypothetical protein